MAGATAVPGWVPAVASQEEGEMIRIEGVDEDRLIAMADLLGRAVSQFAAIDLRRYGGPAKREAKESMQLAVVRIRQVEVDLHELVAESQEARRIAFEERRD